MSPVTNCVEPPSQKVLWWEKGEELVTVYCLLIVQLAPGAPVCPSHFWVVSPTLPGSLWGSQILYPLGRNSQILSGFHQIGCRDQSCYDFHFAAHDEGSIRAEVSPWADKTPGNVS